MLYALGAMGFDDDRPNVLPFLKSRGCENGPVADHPEESAQGVSEEKLFSAHSQNSIRFVVLVHDVNRAALLNSLTSLSVEVGQRPARPVVELLLRMAIDAFPANHQVAASFWSELGRLERLVGSEPLSAVIECTGKIWPRVRSL